MGRVNMTLSSNPQVLIPPPRLIARPSSSSLADWVSFAVKRPSSCRRWHFPVESTRPAEVLLPKSLGSIPAPDGKAHAPNPLCVPRPCLPSFWILVFAGASVCYLVKLTWFFCVRVWAYLNFSHSTPHPMW